MAYNQLTLQERYYIEIEIKSGVSQNEIAKAMGRSQGREGSGERNRKISSGIVPNKNREVR